MQGKSYKLLIDTVNHPIPLTDSGRSAVVAEPLELEGRHSKVATVAAAAAAALFSSVAIGSIVG
jgi:hypothetical protein